MVPRGDPPGAEEGRSGGEGDTGYTRRAFLRRWGVLAGIAAAGSIGGVAVARPIPLRTGRTALRRRFLGQARAVLRRAAGPGAAAMQLTDEELARLGDPSGRQTVQAATLRLPAVAAAQAQGPTPASAALSDPPAAAEGVVARMQRELERALRKPVEQRRWVMVIDTRKCVGCSACTVACKAENHLPPGVVYRPVLDEEIGTYPHVSRRFTPRPCMQCDKPPCVAVCPVGATFKRPDGIVAIDYDWCIGCRYCIAACPYGARTFDWGLDYTEGTPQVEPYETAPSPEYGRRWPRQPLQSPIGNARKCHFCLHRLEAGMLPACVTTCIGAATYFGDASDPESLVSALIGRPDVVRLKEGLGTQPRVYYLI